MTACHVMSAARGCMAGTQPPGRGRPAGLGQATTCPHRRPDAAVTAAPLTGQALKMRLWPPRVAPALCPVALATGRGCPWPWSPWPSSPQTAMSSPCLQPRLGPAASMLGRVPLHLLRGSQPLPSFPALDHWCPQRWPAGLWEQGVQQASLPRLRAAVPLLACPSLRLRGTDLGSAGSGNRRWWDTAPQDRAEPQPSGPGRHTPLPCCPGGLYEGAGCWDPHVGWGQLSAHLQCRSRDGSPGSMVLPLRRPTPPQSPRWGVPVLGQ